MKHTALATILTILLLAACGGSPGESILKVPPAKPDTSAAADAPAKAEKPAGEKPGADGDLQAGKGPRIQVDRRVHDFGAAISGKPLETSFTLRNVGDANLELGKIRSSCGCTVALPSATVLAPGEEGKIDVTFDTKDRSGPNNKKITIPTNDPQQPKVTLEVQANLEQVVAFDPKSLNFGDLTWNQPATKTLEIVGRDAGKVRILKVRTEGHKRMRGPLAEVVPNMKTRIIDERDSGGKLLLECSLEPDLPPGRFHGQVILETDHEFASQITLRVMGRAVGVVTVQPERLFFSNLEPGVDATRTAQVTLLEGHPVELTGVRSEHPSLEAELRQSEQGDWEIVATCDGNIDQNRIRTNIILSTTDPNFPEVVLGVSLIKKRDKADARRSTQRTEELPGGDSATITRRGSE